MKKSIMLISLFACSVLAEAAEGLLETDEVYARVTAEYVEQPLPEMVKAGHEATLYAQGAAKGEFGIRGEVVFAFAASEFVLNKAENYAWLKNGMIKIPDTLYNSDFDQVIADEMRQYGVDEKAFTKGELSCRDGRIQGIWGITPRKISFCDGKTGVEISCDGDDLVISYKPYAKYCQAL